MTTIAPPIQTVLDLFAAHLTDVRFGDLDAQSLARAASDVHAAGEVLAAAQLALDSARGTLQERQEVLLLQVQRALAYARVYAEADESLSARLDAVALPRGARRPRADTLGGSSSGVTSELVLTSAEGPPTARRPRGRPRKSSAPNLPPAPPEPMLEGLAHAGE